MTTEVLGVRSRTRRHAAVLAALAVLTVVTAVVVPPGDVLGIVLHRSGVVGPGSWTPEHEAVVWAVRALRVLLALALGAGLAVRDGAAGRGAQRPGRPLRPGG